MTKTGRRLSFLIILAIICYAVPAMIQKRMDAGNINEYYFIASHPSTGSSTSYNNNATPNADISYNSSDVKAINSTNIDRSNTVNSNTKSTNTSNNANTSTSMPIENSSSGATVSGGSVETDNSSGALIAMLGMSERVSGPNLGSNIGSEDATSSNAPVGSGFDPGDPGDPQDNVPETPLDGGLSVLLAAGIGKGYRSFKKKKNKASDISLAHC